MELTNRMQRLESLLEELNKIDFGYPLGDNIIRSPLPVELVTSRIDAAGCAGVKSLGDFYSICNGLSLPDVHVGYFIKSIDRVFTVDPTSEPHTVILDKELSVLPVGSTGGGSLFVVDCQQGRVLVLPPGPLHDGRYDGTHTKVRTVAVELLSFLDLLSADLEAFVRDDRRHTYIAAQ